MNIKDYIGKRGETIFRMLITKWCGGEPWFDDVFQGEKAEIIDFVVQLIEPTATAAVFYVQVKATGKGYSGIGANKKLNVKVSKKAVSRLKNCAGPAFVVGIDIEKDCGFLLPITTATAVATITGIPTRHRIDCRVIKRLWKEVDDFWKNKSMLPRTSTFSI
jgi:hypothetical protein